MLKRIGLALLYFVVTVIGILIIMAIIAWILPQIGISGFPVGTIEHLLILLAFVYFLIAVIAGTYPGVGPIL